MIPDIPIDIRMRLAELLSFAETATRAENQQSQEATKKNFNSTNLILLSIEKSGVIKFEFQTT